MSTAPASTPPWITGPKVWVIFAGGLVVNILSGVKLIFEFWELAIGNRETVTWILVALCYSVILFSLWFVAFKRKLYMGRRTPIYPKKFYIPARIMFFLLLALTVAFGLWFQSAEYTRRTSRVVLVADFEHEQGQENKNELGGNVVVRIDELSRDGKSVITRPVRVTVGDSDFARTLGRRYNGSLVVWGRAESRDGVDWVELSVEELSPAKRSVSSAAGNRSAKSDPVQIDTSHIQGRVEDLPALTLYVVGVVRYESDEYAAAIAFFTAALGQARWQQDPLGLARLRFYRGNSFLFSSKLQEAIADYSFAIEADPNFAQAYFNRAFARAERHDNKGAVLDYMAFINLASTPDEVAFNNRGAAYAELAQADNDDAYYELAITDYSKAIKINDSYSYAFYNRGDAYSYQLVNLKDKMGRHWSRDENTKLKYEQAVADYSQAIAIDPNFKDAYNNRADAHRVLERYPDAIDDYSEAIQINPTYFLAWYNRGNIFFARHEYRMALSDYSQAILNSPADAEFYYNRGNTYAKLAESETSFYSLALSDYKAAIANNPNYVDAYYNRADLYWTLGQYKEAADDFKRILELPADNETHRFARQRLREFHAQSN